MKESSSKKWLLEELFSHEISSIFLIFSWNSTSYVGHDGNLTLPIWVGIWHQMTKCASKVKLLKYRTICLLSKAEEKLSRKIVLRRQTGS